MVYFNDQLINTYDLDSVNTIINRLAAKNQTISEYLYFEDGKPDINKILENEVITFRNLLPIIKLENFATVYDNFKDIFSIQKIVENYVLLNKEFDELYEREKENPAFKNMFMDSSLLVIINYISEKDDEFVLDKKEINNIWNNRYSLKKNFESMITNNQKNVQKIEKTYEEFSKIIGLQYTDFELEKFKFLLELNIKDISLMEIFNNIKLNKNIPFATTQYFYKIMKDFIPSEKWINLFDRSKTPFDKYKNIDRSNNIILKVLQKTKNTNYNDFTEIILNIEDDVNDLDKLALIKFEYNIKKFDISQEELKDRVLSILDLHDIKNEKIVEVNGVFYFPNQTMNKYVMSDLIMNNPLFSSILVVDETTIGVKSNIYIYFNNPIIGNVTAYLTEQVVLKTNYLSKNKELFPVGSKYIRIKISSCENEKKVKYFQEILSKLFVIYNEKYEEIIEFYKNNLIDIEMEDENIKDTDLKNIENLARDRFKNKDKIFRELRETDPFIFRAIYTRYCRKLPIPITDEDEQNPEIINYTDKNGNIKKYDVITFPKEQVNDSVPRKYICNYDKNINPGLRDNPYENSDVLPYIPCCYVRKQINKSGSKYMNYYFGEKLKEKKSKNKGNIYTSNIILKNNDFGTLPENIDRIFSLVDLTGSYYRKGVFRNKNSFLNCVLEAMNEDTNILEFENEEDRDYQLKSIRKELASVPSCAAACKQEMYDYTIEEIQNKIKNKDEYFDPNLFINLLELKYNCNIFLFKRNNQGIIILPRHTKGYYKNKNSNKCIFIFEHMGSASDKSEYPQCELIVRQIENSEETEYSFDYESEISQNIFRFFENINNYYIFNKKLDLIDFSLIYSPIIEIVSQRIDNYGKTRSLNIIYKGKDITIFTSPIQPLLLNINSQNIIYKSEIDTIIKLSSKLGIIINKQVVLNDLVVQLVGFLGNTEVTIPINDGAIIEGIPIEKNININIVENNSMLYEYNRYKKLARYISEYMYWLYSKFLHENEIDIEDISNETHLENFYKKYIQIKHKFNYGNVNKTFSMRSGVIENNKLIIKSNETLKRLFFVLKMFAVRNSKKLFNYHNKNVIENYYLEISDFDNYPFQIILEGEDSINKWINEKNENNIMNDEIIPEDTNSYFFRNPNIDNNKIFIAQNAENIIQAINIAINWYEYNYNIGDNPGFEEQLENPEFTLYSYLNNKKIKAYQVAGEEKDYEIKIIGYKINDVSKFTVLLDI